MELSKDEKKHRVFVLDNVNETLTSAFLEYIYTINTLDEELEKTVAGYERVPIQLIFSSPGGEVYSGLAISGAIETSITPVHGTAMGAVMSASLGIYVTCHERLSHRTTTFMYHEISSQSYGKVEEQVQDLQELNRLQEMTDDWLLSKTKVTKKKLNGIKKEKRDWYLSAEEALKLGIVDKLIP